MFLFPLKFETLFLKTLLLEKDLYVIYMIELKCGWLSPTILWFGVSVGNVLCLLQVLFIENCHSKTGTGLTI